MLKLRAIASPGLDKLPIFAVFLAVTDLHNDLYMVDEDGQAGGEDITGCIGSIQWPSCDLIHGCNFYLSDVGSLYPRMVE